MYASLTSVTLINCSRVNDVWSFVSLTLIEIALESHVFGDPDPATVTSPDAVSYTHLDVYKRQHTHTHTHTTCPRTHAQTTDTQHYIHTQWLILIAIQSIANR